MSKKPVVIVTGASRGIGAAVAGWLGKAGAIVAMVAREEHALVAAAGQVRALGGVPLVAASDVADPDACGSVIHRTVSEFGYVDALVNNAGVFEPVAITAGADVKDWKRNIEVNLLGPFYMSKYAIPELRKTRGRIVNVSSGAAVKPIRGAGAYCAAKAGLNHFTSILAEEEPDITSVCMRPGVVDTAMQATIRKKGSDAMTEDQVAFYRNLELEGKLEPPHEPARAIAWLALHATRAFTGEFLNYDDPRIRRGALAVFGEHM